MSFLLNIVYCCSSEYLWYLLQPNQWFQTKIMFRVEVALNWGKQRQKMRDLGLVYLKLTYQSSWKKKKIRTMFCYLTSNAIDKTIYWNGKAGIRVLRQLSALQDFSLFCKTQQPRHKLGIICKITINRRTDIRIHYFI